jgi:hypothetical protein
MPFIVYETKRNRDNDSDISIFYVPYKRTNENATTLRKYMKTINFKHKKSLNICQCLTSNMLGDDDELKNYIESNKDKTIVVHRINY